MTTVLLTLDYRLLKFSNKKSAACVALFCVFVVKVLRYKVGRYVAKVVLFSVTTKFFLEFLNNINEIFYTSLDIL